MRNEPIQSSDSYKTLTRRVDSVRAPPKLGTFCAYTWDILRRTFFSSSSFSLSDSANCWRFFLLFFDLPSPAVDDAWLKMLAWSPLPPAVPVDRDSFASHKPNCFAFVKMTVNTSSVGLRNHALPTEHVFNHYQVFFFFKFC